MIKPSGDIDLNKPPGDIDLNKPSGDIDLNYFSLSCYRTK